MGRLRAGIEQTIEDGCSYTDIDISKVMELETGDSSVINSLEGCGGIKHEIQMQDDALNVICQASDFEDRASGKKICLTNGVQFEIIDQKALRVIAENLQESVTYYLWLWSMHVDKTGTKMFSHRATPVSISFKAGTPGLQLVDRQMKTFEHRLSESKKSISRHYVKVQTTNGCT